ncbi:hypothetical protein N7456_013588 [Penicillium angulare]|uniref:Uncharacterized protein n=1 Tax=Penicillium angulare TaxID=116970 RepID=A0A9W9JSS5_9EURO|nr:hypothetical protein N7456_013588 [Penicillium angulare]
MLPTISVLKNLEDLRQRPSPMRLEDAFKFNGFLGYCLEKGMPYALAFNKDMDVKPHLQRVLKTFSSSDASRFPKTCNLLAAWSNVEAAVKAMQTASQPRFLETNPEIFSFNSVLKLGIPTEHCQKLIFTFTSGALSGFAYNGKFFGRIDPSESHHIQIGAFRGIQIARDAFGGLTAIKVKDGQSWSGWIGKPQLALFDIVLEWNGPKKGLIFQFHKSPWRENRIGFPRSFK